MTTNQNRFNQMNAERGNVLFLILIAVVLFAALSYAVTQSSRTGGGDAGRETNLISSAEISQYPAAVKTAIVRMIINGTTYEQLKFNPPSAFSGLGANLSQGVFHPSGGASVFQNAQPDAMVSGTPGVWYFNPNFEVENIGTTSAGSPDGNEFIAFLPGLKKAICSRINEELGLPYGSSIPVTNITLVSLQVNYDDTASDTIPNETKIIGDTASSGASSAPLSGQPFGCFETATAGTYAYYQVLSER